MRGDAVWVTGSDGEHCFRGRFVGWSVTLMVVMAMLVPVTWGPRHDSFPLSSYPMFSGRRADTSIVIVVAVLVSDAGLEVLPTEATGHRHLTQAVRALRHAVRDGGDRAARLCTEVAGWVADSRDGSQGVVGIVTAAYDALDYLLRDVREPTILVEHAWCPVAS